MASAFRELFEQAVEISKRSFPSEAVARQSLDTFQNVLHESATPVDNVMRRVFGHATIREVGGEGGEKAFKIFLRTEPATDLIGPVIRDLRIGNLESVASTLNIAPTGLGTRVFRRSYVKYVRDVFPDVRLAEELAAAKRALPKSIGAYAEHLRPGTAQDLLRAIERDKELEKLVTRLSEHIRKNGGTRFRYVSTFFSLSGIVGSVTAVTFALHEQAKRAAGCWRVYLDPITRELRSCKILDASCRNKDANAGSVCDRTPISFHTEMCRGASPNDECVHCTPTADPKSKHHISVSQYLDPNDMYVCKPIASVGEMLGKVLADVPDMARDVAIDVAGTVSRLWNIIKYVLLAGVGVFLLIFAMYTFHRFQSVVAMSTDDEGSESQQFVKHV